MIPFTYGLLLDFMDTRDKMLVTTIGIFQKRQIANHMLVFYYDCSDEKLIKEMDNTIVAVRYGNKTVINTGIASKDDEEFPDGVFSYQEFIRLQAIMTYIRNQKLLVSAPEDDSVVIPNRISNVQKGVLITMDNRSTFQSFNNVVMDMVNYSLGIHVPMLSMSIIAYLLEDQSKSENLIDQELQQMLNDTRYKPTISVSMMVKYAKIINDTVDQIEPLAIFSDDAWVAKKSMNKAIKTEKQFQVHYYNNQNELLTETVFAKDAFYVVKKTETFFIGLSRQQRNYDDTPDGCLILCDRVIIPYEKIQRITYNRKTLWEAK